MIKIELEKLLEGRSLYWLSKETEIRWATLSAMANGKAQRLNLDDLEAICDVLRCQPGDLLVIETRKKSTRKR
ncbi:MAG TPA: helix-turn-helix transcriptional regulator [Pyrinomonadaceae bacterium]|jgi:putative transcriptional regulator